VIREFLALGDSYTIGEGVREQDRWPVVLAQRIRAAGIPIGMPTIVARTGWTTDELFDAATATGNLPRVDLVTLLIGVNDQYRGYGIERFRSSLHQLLQLAVSSAKLPQNLVVLSIPDWGVTPFAEGRDRPAIAREIDTFNSATRDMVDGAGARYLDITPISRRAEHDRALLADDGLHPSRSMYELWVEALLPVATSALIAS
jgi:lysophospholipase L1-like esterase